jgi:hypothetical protein
MKVDIGMWIDHREAVIVVFTATGEETKWIFSNQENDGRFSGASSEGGAGEDVRDRQFRNHLNSYYAEIIVSIRDANSIQIFGPGEAKGELEKRLEDNGLKGKVINTETADKMIDRQIVGKIRDRLIVQHV